MYRIQLHVLLIIITIVFIANQLGSNGNNLTASVGNGIFAAVRLKSQKTYVTFGFNKNSKKKLGRKCKFSI